MNNTGRKKLFAQRYKILNISLENTIKLYQIGKEIQRNLISSSIGSIFIQIVIGIKFVDEITKQISKKTQNSNKW